MKDDEFYPTGLDGLVQIRNVFKQNQTNAGPVD